MLRETARWNLAERSTEKTRLFFALLSIKLIKNNLNFICVFSAQARSAVSSATVVTGGSQRGFESQVGLFRRAGARSGATDNPGDFSRSVAPGQAVLLGEDLMLRATVRDGDGKVF